MPSPSPREYKNLPISDFSLKTMEFNFQWDPLQFPPFGPSHTNIAYLKSTFSGLHLV